MATKKPNNLIFFVASKGVGQTELEISRDSGSCSSGMVGGSLIANKILLMEIKNGPSSITLVDLIKNRIFTNSETLPRYFTVDTVHINLFKSPEELKEIINEIVPPNSF